MAAPKTYSIHDPSHTSEVTEKFGVTPDELKSLHERSVAAKATAYCPYSKFRVGATLLSKDRRRWIDGANVENASYGVGTCAERTALGNAVTSGTREFWAVGVATDIEAVCSPCGACRQFIREFCALETPVFMFNNKGDYAVMRLSEMYCLRQR